MEDVAIFYGHLVYFTAIWYILWPFGLLYLNLVYFVAIWSTIPQFGIFCGHLVYFMVSWYIFLSVGMLYQEKSGNPGFDLKEGSNFDKVL
jgi:hypothetical protein